MACSEIVIPQYPSETYRVRVDQTEDLSEEITARDGNVQFSRRNFDRIYINVNGTLYRPRARELCERTMSALESGERRNVTPILRFKNIILCIKYINSPCEYTIYCND
jgi:hypothetical protein